MDPIHPILPVGPRVPALAAVPPVRRPTPEERRERRREQRERSGSETEPPRDALGRPVREWREDDEPDPQPTVDVSA